MPATYEPIATTTLTATAATVTFSSIPGTYTDLVAVVAASATGGGQTYYVRINGDTGTNYNPAFIYTAGTTFNTGTNSMSAGAGEGLGVGVGWAGYATSQATAVLNFFSYTNTSMIKSYISTGGQGGVTTNVPTVEHQIGFWNSTAAITSITFRINNATMYYEGGSTFSLYGILKA